MAYAFSKCGFCHPDLLEVVGTAAGKLLEEAEEDRGEVNGGEGGEVGCSRGGQGGGWRGGGGGEVEDRAEVGGRWGGR